MKSFPLVFRYAISDLETVKSGGIFAVLTEARKSEVLDSSQNVHFPKLAVVNSIGLSPIET